MVRSDELEVSDLHALRVDECGADDIFAVAQLVGR
jgi:hypothetical protein